MSKTAPKSRIYDHQALHRSDKFAKEKNLKKTKGLLKFLVFGVLIFLVVVVITRVPVIYGKLQKPFTNLQGEISNQGSINLDYRTNLLLVSIRDKKLQELGFGSLSRRDKKLKVVNIDPETKVFTNSGEIKFAELIYEKGELNLDKLEVSFIKILGYIFDGYIVSLDGTSLVDKDYLENTINKLYGPFFFLNFGSVKDYLDKSIRTNLTIGQAHSVAWHVKNLTPERVLIIDLIDQTLEDGSFDSQSATNKIGLLLSDDLIANEESSVEIVNSSGIEGVGTTLKTVINNFGGNVLSVESGDNIEEKTQILTKKSGEITAKRLETLFQIKSREASDGFDSDLKLIIGKDFGKFFDF